MLKQTPLNAVHRRLGAKMVDFGGWDMPLHYGSQIEEHHRVRRDAGMFDVSHMLAVDLRGAPVRAFLRRLLANNVDKLRVAGRALYSCMLNQRGGVLDDLLVYFMSEEWFRVVVNAATAERDLQWITARRDEEYAGVEIAPRRDLALIAVQGPNARSRAWRTLPAIRAATEGLASFHAAEAGGMFVARTGYTGEDGFELMLPAARAADTWEALRAAGVAPAGLGARDTLRLEAGLNLYGQDMDETVTPMESGLAWTVDLSGERDFIGRPGLPAQPARRLVGLLALERGVLRAHQKVQTAHGEGEITSGSFSPTLEQSIALARVPAAVAAGDEVKVDVRGRMLAARVVKYPFVRHGKALV
jgi:aminomethyltransferase